MTALQILGNQPHLSYNAALCCYRLHEYPAALKHIGKSLSRFRREKKNIPSTGGLFLRGMESKTVQSLKLGILNQSSIYLFYFLS